MNSLIELNGKRYDAVTGELFVDTPKPAAAVHHSSKAAPKTQHRMDDIVRTTAAPVSKKVARATAAHHAAAQPTKPAPKLAHPIMDITRGPKQHLAAHKPEHTKTLMRHAVHKPSDSLKRHVKPQIRTDILIKSPSVVVLPKLSFDHIDSERLRRAKRIAKSRLIRRFAPFQPAQMLSTSAGSVSVAIPAASHPVSKPTTVQHAAAHAASSRSMDVFERALAHANSHEQPAVHPKKHAKAHTKRRKGVFGRRALSTTAVVVAIVLVGGFIGLQNKANITMRVASSKAGFHATLPGYKPSGFAIGKFNYSPGVVAVSFHSNSDSRAFNITQKTSNWDSETLLDNYVATNNNNYQAFQDNGRTVYIYGNNNATWVNNGVWYQVTDNGSLSTNQVLQLAQSM